MAGQISNDFQAGPQALIAICSPDALGDPDIAGAPAEIKTDINIKAGPSALLAALESVQRKNARAARAYPRFIAPGRARTRSGPRGPRRGRTQA
jgi:hypothetical protein